ncbi:HAMP domain-containing histidine kinase [Phototrophicus methaneseepsis]|uniref:histidine kinase n=1 Tax=Phototrophicus methaneseepsis TaxID=2710758 RepID=A0A7S8IGN7_9CHLR|nr:HAMP domain-containing sensor histidine kinase [Phototrophicus methaneseepsis]QPC84854.1 HAMP domain-containing histidine kinase [Phototrophicus methaneseepsis]
MPDETALQQAQDQLNALLEAARSGQIIPVRLPGQIETIAELLKSAQKEHAQALDEAASKAGPADMDAYMQDEAYFVGHAVHELRTPMTSIRGYTDMLGSMGELNDMQKQFMGVIKTNIKRMEGLLADVSYMNKIRKDTLKIEKKMDLFKNIAMRVEKNMETVAEELGRTLIFETPDGLPLLMTDGDMLALAIGKFVENGLRYYEGDEGKVTVSASADGNTLVIKITDNGIGISEDDLAQLGTIYFRADHDVVRQYKGSGLGIPIAYGLVKKLGGTYDVMSTVDEGTTFTIRLEGMS